LCLFLLYLFLGLFLLFLFLGFLFLDASATDFDPFVVDVVVGSGSCSMCGGLAYVVVCIAIGVVVVVLSVSVLAVMEL